MFDPKSPYIEVCYNNLYKVYAANQQADLAYIHYNQADKDHTDTKTDITDSHHLDTAALSSSDTLGSPSPLELLSWPSVT